MMFRKPVVHPTPQAVQAVIADREFLPPALSILETPASPVQSALLLAICGLVVFLIAWATIGRISILAVGTGKLQPQGRVRTVQVLTTGRVQQIDAVDGSRVQAGDTLFTLDPAEIQAELVQATQAHLAAQAEALRRAVAVAAVEDPARRPVIDWPGEIPADLRLREERVLNSDLVKLHDQTSSLAARVAQEQAQSERTRQDILVQSRLLSTLQQRVDMDTALQRTGAGSRATLLASEVEQQRQAAIVVASLGQRSQLEASLDESRAELNRARSDFEAENDQKRADAERNADDAAARMVHARTALANMTVSAPISGTVEASSLTTIGQVLSTGEEALRIVPADVPLQVEAYIKDEDIGFVHTGQPVVIKVNAFPFTRYGGLPGHVSRIAGDAIPASEAQGQQNMPGHAARSRSVAGGEEMQDLVFPITVTLDSTRLMVDGLPVRLAPGMAVSAEIQTGSRRLLSYILSPVDETLSRTARER